MRRLLISTAIIALLGCGESNDSNDQTSTDGVNPDGTTSTGMMASPSDGGPTDNNGTARTDVIALAQEAGEATADQCPNGGVVLNLGVDTNGNGTLDDDEVTDNEVICNGRDGRDGQNSMGSSAFEGVLEGNYTIKNSLDLELIRGVTEIAGSLSIVGFTFDAGGLTRVELPALTSITGDLNVDNCDYLTALSLPLLNTIGRDLKVTSNEQLSMLSLPALTTVAGRVDINYNGFIFNQSCSTTDVQAQLDAGNGVQCERE